MRNRVTLGVWILLSFVAAYTGPFGTFDVMAGNVRAVYWTTVVGVSIFIGYLARGLSLVVLPADRPILVDLLSAAILTALFAPLLWVITAAMSSSLASDLPTLRKLVSYVAPMALAINIARRILPGVEEHGYFDRAAPAECPRLFARFDCSEGRILRLSSRDHFVDVVFADRTEAVRMRFRDAVSEMDPVDGAYVHRSHWVAEGAVARSERAEGRVWLILENGDKVPVSRSYRDGAEARGWI